MKEPIHIAPDGDVLVWRVHVPSLFKEILNNPGTSILRTPLRITSDILAEVASRAIELNDPKLNALMCQLTLFEQSDPYSKGYDADATQKTINAAYK